MIANFRENRILYNGKFHGRLHKSSSAKVFVASLLRLVLLCSVMVSNFCCIFFFLGLFLRSTDGAFTFILRINSHTTHVNCDLGSSPECETYFSVFCLRGSTTGRSTDVNDCPLGANRNDFSDDRGEVRIQSLLAWEVYICIIYYY